MSKTKLYLLGIITTIVIGCFLYPHFCCEKCTQSEKESKIQTPTSINKFEKKFEFSDENINYACDKNFNFEKNGFKYLNSIDPCIKIGIEKLKAYLSKNKETRLEIIGYADAKEKNTSAFPNLGFARANDIKNYFISKGISSNRFEIYGEVNNNLKIVKKTVFGAISLTLTKTQSLVKAENWDQIKDKYSSTPLILNFDSNQTEISLSDTERESMAEIVKYIDNVANSKIICTGHTDNSGDRIRNIELGLERANFAKNYLVKNGLSESKIETSSKGQDEPISDNLTPEGKAKNRRTVITLK